MKICYLLNNYSSVGGIERLTCMLSNELSKKNDVSVISLYNTFGKCPYEYNQKINIKVVSTKKKKKYLFDIIPSIVKLRNIVKDEGYDYLIYAGEYLSPYALLACRNTKTKPVGWSHSPILYFKENFIQKPIKKLMVKKSSFVITLTKKSAENGKKEFKTNNIFSIPNPIDPELLIENNVYNEKSKSIITVGRICEEKNYEVLVKVARIVLSKLNGWTWDVYGDGDTKMKNDLLKLVEDNNLNGKLNFKGNSNNIYDIYKNYSLYVMTSKSEGFPMVLLEAMSKKLPMISFDISTGPSEMIDDSFNGYLIKPFDIEEMANKIIELANDVEKRKTMSKNCESFVNKYNISKIANEWEELLSSQLKN